MQSSVTEEGKNKGTALILAILLGGLGAHRIYTGHILTGILFPLSILLGIFGIYMSDAGNTLTGTLMSLTCFGVQIWAIIDIVSIAKDSFLDNDGNPLIKRQRN
jgi:TM2 domain-containing membrane protein YozV